MITISFNALGSNCVINIEQQLKELQGKKPTKKRVSLKLESNKYTLSPFNFFGIHNHFQGIALKDNYLFISGADKASKSADLFIFKKINEVYSFVDKVQVNKQDLTLWHAGAIKYYKEHLYIPIERLSSPLNSKILLYNLKTEELQNFLSIDYNKTGALDIFQMKSKEILILFDTKEISIIDFISKKIITRLSVEVFEGSSAFVLKDCNQKVYITVLSNTGILSPILNGKDILKLYELNTENFQTKFVNEYIYNCEQCNLRGASSVDIINGKIQINSTPMYKPIFDDHFYLESFI